MNFRNHIFEPAFGRTGPICVWNNDRGRAVLRTLADVNEYIVIYSPLHHHKLRAAFNFFNLRGAAEHNLELVDWGCGTGLATWVFCRELLNVAGSLNAITSMTLIEPSPVCLHVGWGHLFQLAESANCPLPTVYFVNKLFSAVHTTDFTTQPNNIKLHFFSNVLDMLTIDLESLHETITSNFAGLNYFITISPLASERIDRFFMLFCESHHSESVRCIDVPVRGWTYDARRRQIIDASVIQRYERQFFSRI